MQELQAKVTQAQVEIIDREKFEQGIADIVANYENYTVTTSTIKDDKQVLADYTKKILKIYLLCILLYLPINIYMGSFKNIDIIIILKDIFINGTLYHLWYFPALIVGVWITYYLVKKLGRKKTLIATILLYIIGVFGDSYYGITIMNQITKNIYELIFNIFD